MESTCYDNDDDDDDGDGDDDGDADGDDDSHDDGCGDDGDDDGYGDVGDADDDDDDYGDDVDGSDFWVQFNPPIINDTRATSARLPMRCCHAHERRILNHQQEETKQWGAWCSTPAYL